MGSSILAILSFLIVGYSAGSVRIIKEGKSGIVERLGRYKGTLSPGLNFIVPLLDRVILIVSLIEEVMQIPSVSVITKDGISLDISSILYWRVYDAERTYYAVEDVRKAIHNLSRVTLRTEIGQIEFDQVFNSRERVNRTILDILDEATAPWGVKINRIEIDKIIPPDSLLEALEIDRATKIRAGAKINSAQAEKSC